MKKTGFQEVIEQYDARIFNLLLSLCGNPEEAKELTQETFVRAYKSFKGFRQKSGIYTWLYRIAVNTWKNNLKYLSRHKTVPFDILSEDALSNLKSPEISLYKNVEHSDTVRQIMKYIEELPLKYKIPITLYINNLSYEEIAETMKRSVGQSKSLVFRAKLLLINKISR